MSIHKAFMLEIWSEFFFLYISHFFDIILIFDMHQYAINKFRFGWSLEQ